MSKQTHASPMSYVGSTRRLSGFARRQKGVTKVLAWGTVALLLPLVWVFLAGWYFVVFVIFGLFTIPFRFFRRGQRKSLAVQKEQLAIMQAMKDEVAAKEQP